MSDLLLDTTIFIDYYRGDQHARGIMEQVMDGQLQASFSPMSVLELWLGNMSAEEEDFHRGILSVLDEAALTGSVAERAAGLLRSLGSGFPETMIRDALIGATASERGEPVCTRNLSDFQRFGIAIRTY